MNLDVLSLLGTGPTVQLQSAIQASTSSSALVARPLDTRERIALVNPIPTIDVPAEGRAIPFDLGLPLAGSDRLELAPVTIEVEADPVADFPGYSLGELPAKLSADNSELVLTVPAGRHLRTAHLANLKSEGADLSSEQQLRQAERRLAVSTRDPRGGWAAPVASVPHVDRRKQLPASLTGASYSGNALRLPDLLGSLRLTVVDGETPDKFTAHPMSVGTVVGWAAPTPVDLTLTSPDGTVLWNFPGALPTGAATSADVTVALTAALEALREAGQPISGALQLSAKFPAKVGLRVNRVRGEFVRALPGTTSVALAGEPLGIPVATPLPPARPTSVVADVTVKYAGARLADVSDPLPAPGAQSGVVVRQQPVRRTLPPLALRGETVTRIGLVGYCPEPTDLLVRLVPATPAVPTQAGAGPTGPALGTPGNAKQAPARNSAVIWVDLPAPVTVEQPVAVEVSAGTGTLHWVAAPEPLVRIVVRDPDPGGRPILLGAVPLLTISQTETRTVRANLPATAWEPGAAGELIGPALASALFCTVEITDAELRYARGA